MSSLFWRLISVFGSALVLLFYSEFFFVNEGPVFDLLNSDGPGRLAMLAEIATYYALFAYILLIIIEKFGITTLAGLLLAGSLFGWATEALIVPLAHEAPPISWIFPSLGWHALVDVMLGWYLLRIAMRYLSWPRLTAVFVLAGVAWGFWATWFWSDTETGILAPLTLAQFNLLAAYAGSVWIVGLILADIGASRPFQASKWEIGLVALAAIVLYAGMGLAFLPWSLGLLTVIGLTFALLWRARKAHRTGADVLAPLATPPPVHTYALAALLPLTAVASYGVILAFGWALPTELAVTAIFVAGSLGFIWAVWRVLVRESAG